MDVSFEDFLRSGKFGQIVIGMSKAEINSLLGEPDFIGIPTRKYLKPQMFEYGCIEFYFMNEDESLN